MESQNHWFTYDEKMQVLVHTYTLDSLIFDVKTTCTFKVESVAQAVSNLAIQFGDSDDDAGVMSRC